MVLITLSNMNDALLRPPSPCPTVYAADVSTIHEGLSKLYTQIGIPYFIQSSLAGQGFVTIGDVKWRWGTPQDAISNSPAQLLFTAGLNGYDAGTSLHTAIRLGQLVELVTKAHNREVEDTVKPEMDDYKATLMTGQRQDLEKAYLKCYSEVAKINNQGSDHFTAVVNRAIGRGAVPYTDLKHMVPYMPDFETSKTSTRKKTSSGEEFVEESVYEPSGEKQWKQTMTVFRTTLLMCLAGNPNQANLKLTKESLDEFYDWMYGDELLQRSPAPSLKVVMYTERKAWKNISIYVHEGSTLQDALAKVRTDSMFWIREVYERIGRGKGTGEYPDSRSRSRDKGSQDKGKSKGKGKAKGKSKWGAAAAWPPAQATAPATAAAHSPTPQKGKTWAKVDPKNKEYCKKHLVYQNCPGKCGRSHNCPILKLDNTPCNQNHLPGPACPHY